MIDLQTLPASKLDDARKRLRDLIDTCNKGLADPKIGELLTSKEQLDALKWDLLDILSDLKPFLEAEPKQIQRKLG